MKRIASGFMTIGGREWRKWCGHEGRYKDFAKWQRHERDQQRERLMDKEKNDE